MDDLAAGGLSHYIPDILEAHAEMILRALLALPLATAMGALLAFRPRRRGTRRARRRSSRRRSSSPSSARW